MVKTYQAPPVITVFYDGACPICVKEMQQYRRYQSAGAIIWFDITNQDAWLREHGIDPRAALLELHVLDGDGALVTGVDAFILLWQRAPLFRPLAWLAALPGLKGMIHKSYGWFTRRRLAKDGRLPRCTPRQ